LLSVSDTGHGMNEDTVEKIFEPFFSTKAPGKGTGLGLSMVHGIVKNHDGRIICRSAPGKGSCFRIYFPAVAPALENKPAEEKEGYQGGSETILLVDDDENIRNTGQERLESAGYTVRTVSGGEMALEVCAQKAGKIDLVLLDLIMPGMGGARCLRELLQADPAAKVVIISGYSPDDQTLHAIQSSTCGYLRKPYTGEQLLSVVRKALDGGWPAFVPSDRLPRPCQQPRS
jgi:CheY-like chemotaxis protein